MPPALPASDSVHSLADLETWSFAGVALGILGHPIGHTLSPAMHNTVLARLSRTDPQWARWCYFAFEIPPADLSRALDRLHARGFRGLNLTVPHKVAALESLAELDPDARTAGAVNTLLRTQAGWKGFNTDGVGLASAIREDLGRTLAGAAIIIVGAGGAARGAAAECLRAGCSTLAIANRTASSLDALLGSLAPFAGRTVLRGFTSDRIPGDLPADSIVINATSLGLREGDPSPIDLGLIPGAAAAYDMIYNPPVTRFLAQAASRGIPSANGLGMLAHQGAKAFEIWTGQPARETAGIMRAAATLTRAGRSAP
jgi:shikimate dehydrogenase